MIKKAIPKILFKGKDAVLISLIWSVVYLLMTYFLNGTVSSSNFAIMFFGLSVVLVVGVLARNGW
ncbi:MAG: hypothetical protein Q8R18_06390 [bacterium]|nr:hypothetical protein [bacterium]